jgi:hypothetical protein
MTKKIVIGIALLLLGLIVGFLIVVSLQPSTFSVERSAAMAAPPTVVFAQVNDLQAWDAWSPWSKLDSKPKTTISTPSAGKGATFTWDGNDEIGAGTLTILDSKPDESVEVEQAFIRPFNGKARMAFTFMSEGDGTKVTWKMDGTNDFFGKALCMFMDMDAILGKSFEQGLANMKELVEKSDASPAEAAP